MHRDCCNIASCFWLYKATIWLLLCFVDSVKQASINVFLGLLSLPPHPPFGVDSVSALLPAGAAPDAPVAPVPVRGTSAGALALTPPAPAPAFACAPVVARGWLLDCVRADELDLADYALHNELPAGRLALLRRSGLNWYRVELLDSLPHPLLFSSMSYTVCKLYELTEYVELEYFQQL